jgi:Entner-Doudoroff aldolase
VKALDTLLQEKMMTLVRANSQSEGQALADALVEAGVKVIEITLTTPGALKIIANLLKHKGLLVGAGTVRTIKDVKKVEDIGAKFVVSPDTNEDVITATKKLKLVSMPGVCTPTDVAIAEESGADILKLFPAAILGPGHLKMLRA